MTTTTWPSWPAWLCICCSAVMGGGFPQLGATSRWHDATPQNRPYLAEMIERASRSRPTVGLYVRPSRVESPISATCSTGGAGLAADAPGAGATRAPAPTTSAAKPATKRRIDVDDPSGRRVDTGGLEHRYHRGHVLGTDHEPEALLVDRRQARQVR